MTPPSAAARLAQQAARMDAAMSSAITHLTAAVPALDADTAKAALEAAVPIPVRGAARFLEELTGHMDAHPDGLPPVIPAARRS